MGPLMNGVIRPLFVTGAVAGALRAAIHSYRLF